MLRQLIKGSEILASPVNFGALNGACDALAKAIHIIRERDGGRVAPYFEDESALEYVVQGIESALQELKEKRQSMTCETANAGPPSQPESPDEDVEECRRADAAKKFAPDIKKVEEIYNEVFPLTFSNSLGEVRKHLQTALSRLEEVIPESLPVQDDYSLRCAPQVIGAALDALAHAQGIVENELNAATDNPLIFPPEVKGVAKEDVEEYRKQLSLGDCKRAVLSGGNFHGEPIALAMDSSAIALHAIGSIAERRVFHLTTGRLSNGLPRFLTPHAGLQSGLMIAQVTAASLVSENKTLCHPASADSIPTVEDAEDHVSMGAFAARKFAEVVDNVTLVVAIELICAAQGVGYRHPARPSELNQKLLAAIRRICEKMDVDRPFGPDIERIAQAIRRREIPLVDDLGDREEGLGIELHRF
jgi:hypothetical protein